METRLVDCVVRGEELDLTRGEAVDEAAMRSWGASRTVNAQTIRDILCGRLGEPADPRGLRLRGARIAGRLDLENVTTTVGIALKDCYLPEGVEVADASLPAFTLEDCLLGHPSSPALVGDRLRVSALVALVRCTVTANTPTGAVRLVGAHIGGSFSCQGAKITNRLGPALDIERLKTGQNVYLRDGFVAVGEGALGAVRLNDARIMGQLDCSNAHIRNDSGPALNADGMQVEQSLFLPNSLSAQAASERATVCLTRVRVGGKLSLETVNMANTFSGGSLVLVDGLTYSGLPEGMGVDDWLALLGKNSYAAQPYQHLAAAASAAGHDKDMRKILIAQREHQIQSKSLTGVTARAWARLTGWTLGYGYRPSRALIGLLLILAIAIGTCVLMQGALSHTKDSPTPEASCGILERVGVGVDMGLPLVETGQGEKCEPNKTVSGKWLTGVGWVYQLLAWAFATLFIAGFTSAVRKT